MLFKEPLAAPLSVNEHGQVTDEKVLNRDRFKFGFGTILYQSEEVGLGGVPTAIIRSLGGNDFHLGIYGAVNGIPSVFQWFGTLLLRKFNSNRRAMLAAMVINFITSMLIVFCLLAAFFPAFKPFSLWGFLVLALVFAAVGGVQMNIESAWIGDLVPANRLGWFTSVKWILGVLGICLFANLIGKVCDRFPNNGGYASIYFLFSISFIVAMFLFKTVTDRVPKSANFVSSGANHHERLNYKSYALWCYIAFYVLWASGRNIMFAFNSAYLIDVFNFKLSQLALLFTLQYFISCLVIFIVGKFTDSTGNRLPLLFVSGFVALSMLLWPATAWLGLGPVIVFFIINGAAGHTHAMLAINLGLEIFPDKGRSAYLAFSRFFIGFIGIVMPIAAGKIMASVPFIHNFSLSFHGATLTRYHLAFTVATLITFACVIPLLLLRRRKVENV